MKVMHSDEWCLRKDTPHAVYSRRKPRAKGKLRGRLSVTHSVGIKIEIVK